MIIKLNHYISCAKNKCVCKKNYIGQTKWMYLLIGDYDLLEKYNTIWNKATQKAFEYQKTFREDEVTNFYDKEIPKVDSNHT